MKCPNCHQDLERFTAKFPGEDCPTEEEIRLDSEGKETRWSEHRRYFKKEDEDAKKKEEGIMETAHK